LTIKENGDWENVFVGVGVGQDGTVPRRPERGSRCSARDLKGERRATDTEGTWWMVGMALVMGYLALHAFNML